MKRLKISDLSFCDTELQDERSVQGGMLIYSRLILRPSYYLGIQDETLLDINSGYKTQFIEDKETGATGIMMSNKTENSLTVAATLQSSEYSDSKVARSFAYSAQIL